MAAGRLILGSVTDRIHFKRMILLSSILSAILIFVGIMVADQFWIIISWSLSGFVMGPVMPTIFAWTSRLFTKRSGFATGVIYGIGFGGGVFTPWLLGVLADLLSLRLAILYWVFSVSIIGISMLTAHD
jgi:fucose permease